MSRPTDHCSLDLWNFNLDVAFSRAGGMVIWQPRILAWFTDRSFTHTPLPAPYTGLSEPEVYRSLGCSNRPVLLQRLLSRDRPARRAAP